jgi:hypothetical protein
MDPRAEALVAKFVDHLISPDEADELYALAEKDDALAAYLADHWDVERTLRSFQHSDLTDILEEDELPVGSNLGDAADHDQPRDAAPIPGTFARTRRLQLMSAAVAATVLLALWLKPFGLRSDHSIDSTASGSSLAARILSGARHISLHRDGRIAEAVDGAELLAHDRIETGDGCASIAYADDSRIDIDAFSSLAWGDPTSGKRIVLEHGIAFFDVSKQPEDRPMIVSTADTEVIVVGTAFEVIAKAQGTTLRVVEGKVRMHAPAGDATVTAGFASHIEPGEAPSESIPIAPSAIASWRREAPQRNLLDNGDFEAGDRGWTMESLLGDLEPIALDAGARSGSKSAMVMVKSRKKKLAQSVIVYGGKTYECALWAKLDHSAVGARIRWRGRDHTIISESEFGEVTVDGQWTAIRQSVIAPKDAATADFEIVIDPVSDPGLAWIDDCSVTGSTR